MITLYPLWLVKLSRKVNKFLESVFLPAPVTDWEIRCRKQKEIEEAGMKLMEYVMYCNSLALSYDIHDKIVDFKAIYGDTPQVIGWYNSLLVELRNKQNKILNKL